MNKILKNPQGHALQTPWFEENFGQVYKKIENNTLVSPDRCYILQQLLLQTSSLEGGVIECGAFKGGTSYLLAHTLRECQSDKQLYVFDTFKGMPDTADPNRDHCRPGQFSAGFQEVKEFLKEFNPNIYQGLIPEIFSVLDRDQQFCFVHIDVDIYPSTFDSISFIYPRTVANGIIICDDYGFVTYANAAKKAFDDFFASKPENVICLPTGQAMVIKL